MEQIRVRAPAYLERFRCIGPECEDHCCGGWQNVDVDAESFARLSRVDDEELGPALRRVLARNLEPGGPEELGLIPVPRGGACPFLSPQQLCRIQSRLGEGMLPASCDTFPRQAMLVDGTIDLGGRLACPEVARLALLEPDGLGLSEVEPERRLRERGRYWVERPWVDAPEGDPRRQYHLVRGLVRELLAQLEVSLEARLLALGEALGELTERPSTDEDGARRTFGVVTDRLPEIEIRLSGDPSWDGTHELLLRRVQAWIRMDGLPKRYRRCLDRVRDGLELVNGEVGPRTRERYADAAERLYRPYVRRRPWMLGNALLNHLHVSNFPFHPTRSFFEEGAVYACRYGLLKLHLVAAAAAEGGLTDELVVETVQAFEKYVDSHEYWDRTVGLLRREGVLSLEGVAEIVLA